MSEGLEIVIPEESVTENQDSQLYLDSILSSERKDIAYFDEKFTVFVITPKLENTKVNLEVTYNPNRKKLYNLDAPFTTTEGGRSIWKFDLSVIPGQCNNELDIRAYFEEDLKLPDNVLADYQEVSMLNILGVTLVNKGSLEDKSAQKKLVSLETTLKVSPIFQMMFKNIRAERMLTSLELCLCKSLKEMETNVVIKEISVEIANCELNEYSTIKYPVQLLPNMTLTLAYGLTNGDDKRIKPIVAVIKSTVDNKKDVVTKWTTNVDFQGPPPGSTSPNRIASSPMLAVNQNGGFKSRSSSTLLPRRGGHRFKSNSSVNLQSSFGGQIPKKGLVVSVSGQTRVQLGEKFKWNLQLINHSQTKMDLILYIQSSIKKQYEKPVPLIPIQNVHSLGQDPIPLFANNQLIRSYYGRFNKVGLISLTNNLRMTLDPESMIETELELIAIEKGLFNLHDVKILDANGGDTYDCPRLLDVLVV